MHSNNSFIRGLFFALVAFASTDLRPAVASVSTTQTSGPFVGSIQVSTDSDVLAGPGGNLLETTLIVANDGAEPATVIPVGRFTWPDGSTQILDYGGPVTIDAHGAVIMYALSPIPPSVGSGAGVFGASAFSGPIGQGGHPNYPGRIIARDSSSFLLP